MKKVYFTAFFIMLSISAFAQIDPELLKKAEAGDAITQTNLGGIYLFGEGVPKDYKKAFEWLSKAAKQGNARAQNGLGRIYQYGNGVSQDYKKAVEWYSKSAEQGYAKAQANLGAMYHQGFGVQQDYKKAFDLYIKAAEQGFDEGQLMLGSLYYDGIGVQKDIVTGCAWIYLANEPEFNAICDSALTQNQMTRTLDLKNEINKRISLRGR
jgi:TPR repeat protein